MRVVLFYVACCGTTTAISTHPLISDHVVLQTTDDGGQGAVVSGIGAAGEKISVSVMAGASVAKMVAGTADAKGSWQIKLDMPSGGPFDLRVSGSKSANETVVVADVLFGDVYVSGLVHACTVLDSSLRNSHCSASPKYTRYARAKAIVSGLS